MVSNLLLLFWRYPNSPHIVQIMGPGDIPSQAASTTSIKAVTVQTHISGPEQADQSDHGSPPSRPVGYSSSLQHSSTVTEPMLLSRPSSPGIPTSPILSDSLYDEGSDIEDPSDVTLIEGDSVPDATLVGAKVPCHQQDLEQMGHALTRVGVLEKDMNLVLLLIPHHSPASHP